nr:MAG TPA: hypothetical protein [Caudoviricetes sp.]
MYSKFSKRNKCRAGSTPHTKRRNVLWFDVEKR